MSINKIPVVVLIGRPNVGKSTLFNRLCQRRQALTSSTPGTTRDWLEGEAHGVSRAFRLIDTGGYSPDENDIAASVRQSAEQWVREADAVLWMVDGKDGVTVLDQAVAFWLRPHSRKVLIGVNKIDHPSQESLSAEFFRLGYQQLFFFSAAHGRRINGLLECLESFFPKEKPTAKAQPAPNPVSMAASDTAEVSVAVVGRPNVGKSSLINRIIKRERFIVSNVPGTTRDAMDTRIQIAGRSYVFIDTAGLRSKRSKAMGIESLTRIMSGKALERSEVAVLLLDASAGLLEGDMAVGKMIHDAERGCVVGVNKWDTIEQAGLVEKTIRDSAKRHLSFLAHAPIIFLSAKTGHNVAALFEALWTVFNNFHMRLDPEELTAFVWSEIQANPYSYKGRKLVFHSAAQVSTQPPAFLIRCNLAHRDIHFSFLRRLENAFRRRYGMAGSPLRFQFHKR